MDQACLIFRSTGPQCGPGSCSSGCQEAARTKGQNEGGPEKSARPPNAKPASGPKESGCLEEASCAARNSCAQKVPAGARGPLILDSTTPRDFAAIRRSFAEVLRVQLDGGDPLDVIAKWSPQRRRQVISFLSAQLDEPDVAQRNVRVLLRFLATAEISLLGEEHPMNTDGPMPPTPFVSHPRRKKIFSGSECLGQGSSLPHGGSRISCTLRPPESCTLCKAQ